MEKYPLVQHLFWFLFIVHKCERILGADFGINQYVKIDFGINQYIIILSKGPLVSKKMICGPSYTSIKYPESI